MRLGWDFHEDAYRGNIPQTQAESECLTRMGNVVLLVLKRNSEDKPDNAPASGERMQGLPFPSLELSPHRQHQKLSAQGPSGVIWPSSGPESSTCKQRDYNVFMSSFTRSDSPDHKYLLLLYHMSVYI